MLKKPVLEDVRHGCRWALLHCKLKGARTHNETLYSGIEKDIKKGSRNEAIYLSLLVFNALSKKRFRSRSSYAVFRLFNCCLEAHQKQENS
jgi:hypothetical protein